MKVANRELLLKWKEMEQEKASAASVSTMGIQSQSSDWTICGLGKASLTLMDRKRTCNATKGKNILGPNICEKGTKSGGVRARER